MKTKHILISAWIAVLAAAGVACTDQVDDIEDYSVRDTTAMITPWLVQASTDGGTYEVSVQSDNSWTLSGTCDWASLSETSGSGKTLITLNVQANTTADYRECEFNFDCEGKTAGTLLVTQDAPYLAVDLGLSVRWANRNVGAKMPYDFGDYFSWGETLPKTTYTEENYKFANSPLTSVSSKNDAATQIMGSRWRMPTYSELSELRHCPGTIVTEGGVKCMKFTGSTGNSIVIPFAGLRINDYHGNKTELILYSSDKTASRTTSVYCLDIGSNGDRSMLFLEPFFGCPIRGVCR